MSTTSRPNTGGDPDPARRDPDGAVSPHESDDEPMVYDIPKDYAGEARKERERLIADGFPADSIIFMSDLHNHMPPQGECESAAEYAKRYAETMMALTRRHDIRLLSDKLKGDRLPDQFMTTSGHSFNRGPGSGAIEGDYRQFMHWWSEASVKEDLGEMPEQWLKFQKSPERD